MSQKRDRQIIQSLLPAGSTVQKWYLSPVWEVRLPNGDRLQAYRRWYDDKVCCWWQESTQYRGYGHTWQTAFRALGQADNNHRIVMADRYCEEVE
jgi:hypothetical protein